jgi:hypothetical protein
MSAAMLASICTPTIYHCKITGPRFSGLGIFAILETMGVVNAPGWVTWTALIAVLAVGFGLEYRYKGKEATCYCIREVRRNSRR